MRQSVTLARVGVALCIVASLVLPASSASAAGPSADATARLLGYLWADGDYDQGVWDASAPSAGSALIEALVEEHGGTWVDRTQLMFRLEAPYQWSQWKDGLPGDNAGVRAAVENPHFLAAVAESEGFPDGHLYDQFSTATDFTEGRLTEFLALLRRQGYDSATLTPGVDADSGSIAISGDDIADLRNRRGHWFVCPSDPEDVRVAGGESYAQHGPIQWLDGTSEWAAYHRTDCRRGQPIVATPAPPGACTVFTTQPGSIRVSWTFDRGRVSVKLNGSFETRRSALERSVDLATLGSTSVTVDVIRDGRTRTAFCGSVNASVANAPRCRGQVVTILGTSGGDVVYGTTGPDVISTGLGNDIVRSLEGDDVVCAGEGRDFVEAGDGRDIVVGDLGWDAIFGQAGPDVIIAGPGNDTLVGGGGNDRLIGGVGNDRMIGGNGNDRLRGRAGDDHFDGGSRTDVCESGGGSDTFVRCETLK